MSGKLLFHFNATKDCKVLYIHQIIWIHSDFLRGCSHDVGFCPCLQTYLFVLDTDPAQRSEKKLLRHQSNLENFKHDVFNFRNL